MNSNFYDKIRKYLVVRYFEKENTTVIFNKITDNYALIEYMGSYISNELYKGRSIDKIKNNIINKAKERNINIEYSFIVRNIKKTVDFLKNEIPFDFEELNDISYNSDTSEDSKYNTIKYREIRKFYVNQNKPMSAFIEVTSDCNFKCVHCYNRMEGNKNPDLSYKEIIDILDWLKRNNTLKITISGGEPLVRKDIMKIVQAAIKRGFAVVLFTNGYLLTEKIIKQFEEMGVYKLSISFLGMDNATYRRISGVSAANHIKKLFPVLSKSKINILLKTPVLVYNYKQVPQMLELSNKYSLKYFYDVTQMRTGINRFIDDKIFCSIDQISELIRELGVQDNYKNGYRGIEKKDPNSSVCYSGSYSFTIDPKGYVYPCATLRYGNQNIRNKTLDEIWNNGLIRAHHYVKIKDLKKCANCPVKEYCRMCPGTALLANGTLREPDDYICKIMKIIYHGKGNSNEN